MGEIINWMDGWMGCRITAIWLVGFFYFILVGRIYQKKRSSQVKQVFHDIPEYQMDSTM